MKPNYKFAASVFALSIIALWVVAATPDTQRVIVTTTAATRAWLAGTGNVTVTNSNPSVAISGSGGAATVIFHTATGSANSRYWDIFSSPANFELRSVKDDYSAAFTWLKAERDNPNSNPPYILRITINTNLTVNGTLTYTNGLLVSTNAYYGSATLVAGTNLVQNSACTTNSLIYLSRSISNGVPGYLSYAITNATNFIIISTTNADVGTVNWMIVKTQ